MGQLELRQLAICYDGRPVVRDLSLLVADGELVSLLGPSGAGKSTILKTIAGLLQPSSGEIRINRQRVNHLPAEKRDAVLIFQKPLLFPFLNLGENIAFGLKMAGISGRIAEERIAAIMAITGLEGLTRRKVHQLSGGQQQRAALARGLVLEPSVLLLDEPLSALDAELRQQMRELIRQVQHKTGTTMLFVTHDQSEAFAISDRISLLLDGTLRQTGTPEELFYRPADLDVARFFGGGNFIPGQIRDGRFCSAFLHCPTPLPDSSPATAVIRPEDIQIAAGQTTNRIEGTIARIGFEGAISRLSITTAAGPFTVLTIRPGLVVGEKVSLFFPPECLHLLPLVEEHR